MHHLHPALITSFFYQLDGNAKPVEGHTQPRRGGRFSRNTARLRFSVKCNSTAFQVRSDLAFSALLLVAPETRVLDEEFLILCSLSSLPPLPPPPLLLLLPPPPEDENSCEVNFLASAHALRPGGPLAISMATPPRACQA